MKKLTILFLFLFISGFVKAQLPVNIVSSADTAVVDSPQIKAEYPGGRDKLTRFFVKNMRFPAVAVKQNITGKQIVKLLIEKDGSISTIQFLQSGGDVYDTETIRVIRKMPKFTPAQVNGHAVRSYYIFPMSYAINTNG